MRWPWRRPTLPDIYWLAGLIEGEGSFSGRQVSISQKDAESLERVKEIVGGRVGGPYLKKNAINGPTPMFVWYASGERAHGIARTVYHLLSSRRQAQVRKFLDVSRQTELPDRLAADDPTRYLVDFRDLPPGALP